jgi:hypothetical protein
MLILLHPLRYPYSLQELQRDHPLTWFPLEPTDSDLAPFRVARVMPAPMPRFDHPRERCVEVTPEQLPDGTWRQRWEVILNEPGPETAWAVA